MRSFISFLFKIFLFTIRVLSPKFDGEDSVFVVSFFTFHGWEVPIGCKVTTTIPPLG